MISGLLPAYVLHQVGWSIIAFPPLLLLVGLVQLAYCDLDAAPAAQGARVRAQCRGDRERHRRSPASCTSGSVWSSPPSAALAFFALFFIINLMNPRWMAFGDVRLSLVVGFGLAWVSWVALIEGLFFANLLAVIVGFSLIAAHKAERRSAVPFGLYLALGAALVLVTWS